MTHFAKLDANNIVETVIVVADTDSGDGSIDTETVGRNFCRNHVGDMSTNWKQTSYNANFRGNYAGIGYTYMENVRTLGVASTDIFIGQRPHASWTIGINTAGWYAPIDGPPGLTTSQLAAGSYYQWDESAYQADTSDPKTVGWALTTP